MFIQYCLHKLVQHFSDNTTSTEKTSGTVNKIVINCEEVDISLINEKH